MTLVNPSVDATNLVRVPWRGVASQTAGLLNTIPLASVSPMASWADGFALPTMLDPDNGGVPPAGSDINGVLHHLSNLLRWTNSGGQWTYNSTLSSAVSGYPIGSVLQSASTTNQSYCSLIDSNIQNPEVPITVTANISATSSTISIIASSVVGGSLVAGQLVSEATSIPLGTTILSVGSNVGGYQAVVLSDMPILSSASISLSITGWDTYAQTNISKAATGNVYASAHGINGNGVGDSTAAFNNLFARVKTGQTIIIPPGTYNIGTVNIFNKDVQVLAYGAIFNVIGPEAGFFFRGHINWGKWSGGKFYGDNTNRDGGPLPQMAISAGNYVGDNVNNIVVEDIYGYQLNIGIRIAYGEAPYEPVNRTRIANCRIESSVGHEAGRGYGYLLAHAPGTYITGCVAVNCGRHGIYMSEGESYKIINCEVTGCGIGDGSLRGSINISRSASAQIIGCYIHDNVDVGTLIDSDGQGVSPNTCENIIISDCLYEHNEFGDIDFGTNGDVGTLGPKRLTIDNCRFVSPVTVAASMVLLQDGQNIIIQNCSFDSLDTVLATGSFRMISLAAGSGGATENILFKNNTFYQGAGVNNAIALQLAASICINTQHVTFEKNKSYGGNFTDFEFLTISDAGQLSNINLLLKDTNTDRRVITTVLTGSNLAPYVVNADIVTLNPGSSSTYANFLGGRHGQELLIRFSGTGETILHTPGQIILVGSTPLVSTQLGLLKLIFLDTQWQEMWRTTY